MTSVASRGRGQERAKCATVSRTVNSAGADSSCRMTPTRERRRRSAEASTETVPASRLRCTWRISTAVLFPARSAADAEHLAGADSQVEPVRRVHFAVALVQTVSGHSEFGHSAEHLAEP
jgi:hypothetical protein